jgi:putative copper resistance protein D
VHVAAAAAWTGGVVALLVTARTAAPPLFASIVERFGTVALPCAVAVLVTGLLQAIGSLEGLEQLTTTGYGRLIACKLALFAGMIALGARTRRSLVARLKRPAARAMRAAIVFEVALAVLALAAAGMLAGTAPPS